MKDTLIMRKEVDFNLIALREVIELFIDTMICPEDVTEAMYNLRDVVEGYFNNTEDLHCDITVRYIEEIHRD